MEKIPYGASGDGGQQRALTREGHTQTRGPVLASLLSILLLVPRQALGQTHWTHVSVFARTRGALLRTCPGHGPPGVGGGY